MRNILSITMNKNNPHINWNITIQTMKKNQNALPKKVYVIREDDVDAFYYVMLLPEEY